MRPYELYDTKTNPRVRWSCRRCTRRNDAPISLPVAVREQKYCKFCRLAFAFTLAPTVKREPLNVGDWVQVTREGFVLQPGQRDKFRLTERNPSGGWRGEDEDGTPWQEWLDDELHCCARGTPPEAA